MSSLDIVIVNWNTGRALTECVVSVAAAVGTLGPTRIVVVDNASTDASLAEAVAAVPDLVVRRNADNRGFAAACNQGARDSAADYLLFLNPDTVVNRDTLTKVVAFMDHPDQRAVGICGIRLVDGTGQTTTAAARFPTLPVLFGQATGLARIVPGLFPRHLLTERECRTTRVVDQVIGAFFLVRRAVFEGLGGFDERFFVYFEEVDLSYRAAAAGWRSMYYAGAEAVHHGGLSSDQVKAARLFYSLRSRLLYADKHYSRAASWAVRAMTFAIEQPIRRVRATLAGGTAPAETAAAFGRLRTFIATPGWRRHDAEQRRA